MNGWTTMAILQGRVGGQLIGVSDAEFEWLFREESPAVLRTVFLICHDEEQARDITQEAFVQLLRHWKSVSTYERPGAWVRRVAIRQTMRSLRRERLRAVLEREVAPPVVAAHVDVDLLNAIADLPPRQRAATV